MCKRTVAKTWNCASIIKSYRLKRRRQTGCSESLTNQARIICIRRNAFWPWNPQLLESYMNQRRALEETWAFLEEQGEEVPLDESGAPFVPPQMPSQDDEVLGFSFFRELLEDADYSNLTLPRTFFGRSELERVSFQNTDLSESRMCWNDFIECDFSRADLFACDMRASTYVRCKFDQAILKDADFRRSYFEGCTFTGANLAGVIVDKRSATKCGLLETLTTEQIASLEQQANPGPEPKGG